MSQVAVVAEIGGTTVDEATRRMMAFLVENELSRQYTLSAAMESVNSRDSSYSKLCTKVWKKNPLTKEITRKDAEKAVSKWLIGARDRGGNHAMRAEGRAKAVYSSCSCVSDASQA